METTKQSVLVVDDDLNNRLILTEVLRRAGFNVTTLALGSECLPEIEKNRPDIILIDVMLNDMLGTDLCHQIKSQPQYEDIPIVLLSGKKVTPEDHVYGLEIGADEYMTRPFQKDELVARLRALLRFKASTIRRRTAAPYSSLEQNSTLQTAAAFDQKGLIDAHPEVFGKLQKKYEDLLLKSLSNRLSRTSQNLSPSIRELSLDLGFLKASARDVIDLHKSVLITFPSFDSAEKSFYLKEESKILLVELLGYLVNYYRNTI